MNRHDLQKLAEAYNNVHEGTMDIKGFEIPKKERDAAAKRVKEKTAAKKKKNIRGYDSEEQKKRLEKKRGMKLDDHPQFKKEENDINEVLGGQPGDGYVGHPRLGIKNPISPPKKETKVAPKNTGLAGRLGNRATEIERMLGNSYEPEGDLVDEQSSTSTMRDNVTDALPWNRNTKYTTQGKLRKPGENVHGKQTGRGLNTSTGSMGTKTENFEFSNAIHEAYEEDIKEFVGAMLGNAVKNAASGVVNSAGQALASPVGAALAGGTVGAVTGGKKKTKKALATGAGAAVGAALGGLKGAAIGGLAGNVLS